MSDVLWFVWGFADGSVLGAWFAGYYWLRHYQPKVELKIDPAVLSQISSQIVTAWLEQRGLVWMPKGVDWKAKQK